MPCDAHRYHAPEPVSLEGHHVIPQAWQKVWRPGEVGLTAEDIRIRATQPWGAGLWEPRVVPLCPTGHSNVHHWIVRMMREVAKGASAAQAIRLVRPRADRRVFGIATEALLRFEAAGGDLLALARGGQLGYGVERPVP